MLLHRLRQPPPQRKEPLRVLLLAANPSDTEALRLDEEARTIEEVLAQAQISSEVYYATAVRPRDLPKKLRTVRPHFVHFSGHGKKHRGIVLENERGLAQLVSQQALSSLFRLVKGVKCVFLNCCYSETQAEAISQHVPYVIGTKDAISDKAAIEFSFGFYQAIADGEPVPSAFEFGKNAVEFQDYSDEADIPVLFRRKAGAKNSRKAASGEVDPVEPTEESSRSYSANPAQSSSGSKGSRVSRTMTAAPMAAQEPGTTSAVLGHLWNRIEQGRELLIVLGSESCCEGRKEGEPYPSFAAIARRILADEGRDPEHISDLRQGLRNVLQFWSRDSDELESFLRKYTAGEPGPAHYYLAALALTLFPEYNLRTFVAAGFDDLMEQAISHLQKGSVAARCKVFRFSSTPTDEEVTRTFQRASDRLRRGDPTIVKIFGDLGARSPLVQRKAKLAESLSASLQDWFQRPILLVGCGQEDKALSSLVLNAPRRGPVFIVGEVPVQHRYGLDVHRISMPFGHFVMELVDLLRSRDRTLLGRIESLLRRLEPHALYPSYDAIVDRSEIASRPSLLRMEERLPRIESEDGDVRTLVPISRSDTQPDFPAFLRSDRPLMAVIGESGTGKSTLFFQIHQVSENYIPILYSVHELQGTRTLAARLAQDFLCEKHNLEHLLAHLDRVLNLADTYLLILVDGLNESGDVKPATLRSELESLACRLPQRIKIAYSCRKVYWDNYIRPESEFPKRLYFSSKEVLLGRFSLHESEEAFHAYQSLYSFRGTYALLSGEFKERITDPLMLRMLAEGYQDKELPSFAPAVLIFEAYERRFRETFTGTYVPSFLKTLIARKVDEARSGQPSDQFEAIAVRIAPDLNKLILLQLSNPRRPGDPLDLLEDEGILSAIDQEKTAYRFTYDRFFEYLLGKGLSAYSKDDSRGAFLSKLRRQVQDLISLHFSFLQALKSEIVRLNIIDPQGPWSMYDAGIVRSLLDDSDTTIREFSKDLLRELMFEGREDLLPIVSRVFPDPSLNHILMLDLAPDSARTLPLVVEALTTEESSIARRCCRIVGNFISDPKHREDVESTILRKLLEAPFSTRMASGLIYYTACIFGDADRRGEDPFPLSQRFWAKVWATVGRQTEAADTITNALVEVLREEGGRFFGDTSPDAMDYIWTVMTPECKELGRQLVILITDTSAVIGQDMREIMLFFGSCIRDWSDRKSPSLDKEYGYKFEYRMTEWILIQRSRDRYQEVKEILEGFVSTGYTRSIEFALSNMEYSCLSSFRDDPVLLRDAYQTMKKWMKVFKQDEAGFYWALDTEDPYSLNECPLTMVGRISILDEFAPREGQVDFLVSWFESEDRRDRLFALLCARSLWPYEPRKILKTLDLVAHSSDTTMATWLDRLLKEIYLVFPRSVEDFFHRNNIDAERVRSIKHRSDIVDPSGTQHQGDALYKSLFTGPQSRRAKFGEWYIKLHQSSDLESFCRSLVRSLLAEIDEY